MRSRLRPALSEKLKHTNMTRIYYTNNEPSKQPRWERPAILIILLLMVLALIMTSSCKKPEHVPVQQYRFRSFYKGEPQATFSAYAVKSGQAIAFYWDTSRERELLSGTIEHDSVLQLKEAATGGPMIGIYRDTIITLTAGYAPDFTYIAYKE